MKNTKLLILGIGNILWADEGFGVRCVEALANQYAFEDDVVLMDGGTQGLYLLPYIEDAEKLIVFDAVDYGMQPGDLLLVKDDEVPRFMGVKKMSLHQTGFQEVIMCAALQGRVPESMVLIGVQPEELEDYGGSLRDVVKARIPDALEMALNVMREWNVAYQPKGEQPDAGVFNNIVLEMASYETGRPDADAACRVGDARVLAGMAKG